MLEAKQQEQNGGDQNEMLRLEAGSNLYVEERVTSLMAAVIRCQLKVTSLERSSERPVEVGPGLSLWHVYCTALVTTNIYKYVSVCLLLECKLYGKLNSVVWYVVGTESVLMEGRKWWGSGHVTLQCDALTQ